MCSTIFGAPWIKMALYSTSWFRNGALNRPKAYNALNRELAERLLDALIRCDEDEGVRAVVISGKGPSFCAGGDISR
jgi:enoyl-CoA hydratase/carnithine racemase